MPAKDRTGVISPAAAVTGDSELLHVGTGSLFLTAESPLQPLIFILKKIKQKKSSKAKDMGQ